MKIYNKLEQGTEEWFACRKGKMTASHAQAIGANGKGLETYITELMAESYSIGEKTHFTNEHMERGNELEDQARSIYAFNTGSEVTEVGFIERSEHVGCSPDGLVGDDGLVEIKCPSDVVYFKHLLSGEKEISTTYIWQMQMQMLVSGRKWCDYVAYNPNFEKSIFIHRINIDEDKQKKLLVGIEMGEQKITSIYKIINK